MPLLCLGIPSIFYFYVFMPAKLGNVFYITNYYVSKLCFILILNA